MGAKAVLQQLYQALEADAALVALTGHRPGATTLAAGARIVGDAVRLRPHPIPGIVIGLGSKAAGRGGPSQPEKTWTVQLLVYGQDVFQVAEMLDALEAFTVDRRWPSGPIRRVLWDSAQQLELTEEQQYISAQVLLSISYL